MLPIGGLYLPETLHRQNRESLDQGNTEPSRLKCFQRKTERSKHEASETEISLRSFFDAKSTETVDDFPSIAIAFQFADFVSISSTASPESKALSHLISQARKEIREASCLYLSTTVAQFLEAWPDKKASIDTALVAIRRSLNDIGHDMDELRSTADNVVFGRKRKFEWSSSHRKRLLLKQQTLSNCHQSLLNAIDVMQVVELCVASNGTWQDPIYEAPAHPWIRSDDSLTLRGPYSRREYRMSQKNLSLSSMHLPEGEPENSEITPINPIPAELPGSTLEDLINSYYQRPQAQPQRYIPYNRPSSRHTSPVMENNNTTHIRKGSLDQILLGPFFLPQKSDASFATANSPVELETRSTPPTLPTLPTFPRTYFEFIHSLPALTEKPIERTDSIISTTAVIMQPQLAQRYRPHPDRHRSLPSLPSLPSELPHLQNQSSLTEDLADWMMISSVQSGNGRSTEPEKVPSSPSTSVLSYPSATRVPDRKSATSLTSSTIIIARRPLPETALEKIVSRTGSVETSKSRGSSIREADSSTKPAQEPSAHDADLSLLQQKLLRQTYIASSEDPSISKSQPVTEDVTPEPPHAALAAKPVSAQVKRRAAQQRRMQLAFRDT